MGVCGAMRVTSKGGAKYFAVLTDDYSHWCEVSFLAKKFKAFTEFRSRAETMTEKKVKCVQSDNGTEYINNEFYEYLKLHGIARRLTVPHTPQH